MYHQLYFIWRLNVVYTVCPFYLSRCKLHQNGWIDFNENWYVTSWTLDATLLFNKVFLKLCTSTVIVSWWRRDWFVHCWLGGWVLVLGMYPVYEGEHWSCLGLKSGLPRSLYKPTLPGTGNQCVNLVRGDFVFFFSLCSTHNITAINNYKVRSISVTDIRVNKTRKNQGSEGSIEPRSQQKKRWLWRVI